MIPLALYNEANLVTMARLPDNSVDSIITDPPYGLGTPPPIKDVLTAWLAGEAYHASGRGFMGKEWDAFVPGPEIWRECLRVLKPGGIVYDPFAGSGSTLIAAWLEDFGALGSEMDAHYCEIYEKRRAIFHKPLPLF